MERPMVQGRGGCFSAVGRCFWGKPKEDLTRYRAAESDTIEFEDLVTAETRASVARAKKQMVTETERELLRSGRFNELVEEQRRIDAERDAELKRQEEKLKQEEEAYYMAKREAARRTTQLSSSTIEVSLENERQPQSQPDVVIHHQPRIPPTSLVTTHFSSQVPKLPTVSQLLSSSPSQDEEDFDQFLESVKARQLSITKPVSTTAVTDVKEGGCEEEEEGDDDVDFGYWEKAELPIQESSIPMQTVTHTATVETSGKGTPLPALPRDMDLSLL